MEPACRANLVGRAAVMLDLWECVPLFRSRLAGERRVRFLCVGEFGIVSIMFVCF